MRRAARGRERIDAIAAGEERGQCDEVGRRNAVDDKRLVTRRVGTHVTKRVRLGAAFEALEEGHVARQMWHLVRADAGPAIHSGEIEYAILAVAAHAFADDLSGAQHAHDLLVGALENTAARIADDRVNEIPETIRRYVISHRSVLIVHPRDAWSNS